MSNAISNHGALQWSYLRIALCVLLVGIVFFSAQVIGMIVAGSMAVIGNPSLNVRDWAESAATNGVALAAATFSSTLLCIPVIWALVRSNGAAHFLRLRVTSAKSIALWCSLVVVFVAASDLISLAFGRPVVPDFMVQAYASAPPLLIVSAIVVAAPLFEEIFFRGFLMSALEARGLPAVANAIISAALWAGIHVQYDFYNIVSIFLAGLLLAAARIKTGSVVPCFVMHALNNAIATVETALVAEGVVG
jgi:membrane protease YdiL (CAAX protease family)